MTACGSNHSWRGTEKVIYDMISFGHSAEWIRMVKACLLVNCRLLKTKKVVDLAKKQAGVKDAFPVHGRWDIAVLTDELDLKTIAEIGIEIYKAEGVEIVETLVGFPEA